jgi:hypothetical protein
MALHTELPIYKVAYDLLGLAIDLTRNIPREVKLIVGGRMRDLCVELVMLVYKANTAKNKTPHLDVLLERVVETELLFRVSRDKQFISNGQYARAFQLTVSIGKQANGWRKHYATSPAL